jgi:hypothetical protein
MRDDGSPCFYGAEDVVGCPLLGACFVFGTVFLGFESDGHVCCVCGYGWVVRL